MTSGRAFSTFGPRYSNICASLLLTRTHTPSTITIWTQTATFYTAPPTQVPPAKPVPSLTCVEAHELLQNTPHLLHPLILTRAQQTGARIRLCSTHDPLAIGTIIEPSSATQKKAATISTLHPPAITLRSNITLISIASNRGLAPTLFFKDLFALVARHALPTLLTTTFIVNVTFALPASSNLGVAIAGLKFLRHEAVTVESGYAILSVVGEKMWYVKIPRDS